MTLVVTGTGGVGLKLRRSPELDGPISTILPDGTLVEEVGGEATCDGHHWLRIKAGAKSGWSASEYLGDPSLSVEQPRIQTRFGPAPADLSAAVMRHFPTTEWANACELSYYESGWDRTARNNTLDRGPCGTRYWYSDAVGWAQTEDSVGYFQINVCAHGADVAHWEDPDNAARKAAELFAARGNKWTDWVVSAGRLGLPV